MIPSRRSFLKATGALVVSFCADPVGDLLGPAAAQDVGELRGGGGQFGTHASHVDPKALDSWIALHRDGSVIAYTGKCDLGQGILTAQTQLVAEELCVALDRVTLVQCDTSITPDQGSTSGSQSTPTNFNDRNLALAAATAREALLQLASEHLNEPKDQLAAAQGMVRSGTGKQVRYEELLKGKRFSLDLNPQAKRRARSQWTVLGTPVPSLDRPALMTGQFEFVQHVRVPKMLHARVVRPPAMGATLLRVEKESVQNVRGLVKVVVRQDLVAVVAETQYAAITAARLLRADWRPGPRLPAQATFFDHLRQQQPSHDALEADAPNVDEVLKAAPHVIRSSYTYPYQAHGSVGTSCAVADVSGKTATVWSATQSVYPTRSCIATLLNLQPDNVRVIFTRGSGCYGLNGADAVSFEAAVISQIVGRPVRLQYSRQDELMWENFGSPVLVHHSAALNREGQVTAWHRESWIASRGSRPGYDRPGNIIAGMLLGHEPEPLKPGPPKPPQGELRNGSNTVPGYMAACVAEGCGGGGTVRSGRALTHTVMSPFFTGPLRSPLRIQNTFANECFMDELAHAAAADPVAFRLRHLEEGRLSGVVKAAAKASSWSPRSSPLLPVPHTRVARGRGMACVGYEGKNGYAALVADVEVHLDTGVVTPRRFLLAIDCGPVSNPDGLRNQCEGGILQGMSRSLVEEVTWDEQRVTSSDWETYNSLRLDLDPPPIEIVFVQPEGVEATGAGETAITVTPAAIGNAIFDATGARIREVPFTPTRVLAALHASRHGQGKTA